LKSTDNEGGEKRPYSSQRSRPYSGRPADGDNKPKREYKSDRGDREGGDRRSGSDRPRSPRTTLSEKSFGTGKPRAGSGEKRSDSDRPYTPRTKSGEKRFDSDKPRTPRAPQGDRKFAGKRGDDFKAKPFRKDRDSNTEFRDKPAAPKTMRGRKEKEAKDDTIRLNRYIANAGICSRRKADELIEAGVIAVNGNVISELGFKVNPMKDEIRYNGELLKREKNVYVLLNKPKDYITTTDDQIGR